MYLGAVQAPGLGKFWGQRTRPIKVFEKCQNFRKSWESLAKSMFTAQNRASGMSQVLDFVEHVLKGIEDFHEFRRPCRELRPRSLWQGIIFKTSLSDFLFYGAEPGLCISKVVCLFHKYALHVWYHWGVGIDQSLLYSFVLHGVLGMVFNDFLWCR